MGQLDEELRRSPHAGGTHVEPGTPALAAVAPDRVRAVLLRLASAGELVLYDLRTLGLVSTRGKDQLGAALGQAWHLLRPGDMPAGGGPALFGLVAEALAARRAGDPPAGDVAGEDEQK